MESTEKDMSKKTITVFEIKKENKNDKNGYRFW